MHGKYFISIIALVFGLTLACGNSNTASTGGGSNSSAEEEKPAEKVQAYSLNQDVQVGEIRWKFLEVKDLGQELKSDNQFIKPKKTSGKFIQIRFEVENQGTEAASYAGIDLVDGKDRTFKPYDERFSFVPEGEGCVLEQLNPNLTKTCTEIFEIPADASSLEAVVGDLELLGGEEARVDLGI